MPTLNIIREIEILMRVDKSNEISQAAEIYPERITGRPAGRVQRVLVGAQISLQPCVWV